MSSSHWRWRSPKSEVKEKKQLDFTIEMEFMAEMEAEGLQIDNYFTDEMLVKYRAGPDDKSKVLGKLEQEQKQLSVIIIKE